MATAPARPGARVALQAYDRDHFTWRTIARARLDGTLARPARHSGAARPIRLRVVVRGDEGWADGATTATPPRPLIRRARFRLN